MLSRYTNRSSKCHARTISHRRLLCVEALENRRLLAITVTNLEDTGAGSLRMAIEQANAVAGPEVIQFAPKLQGTITVESELEITDDLTINGRGTQKLTISGGNLTRVFHISGSDTEVSISHLKIADGVAGEVGGFTFGGGILNNGAALNLAHVQLVDNSSSGFIAGGAAIANVFDARLSVTHSTFLDNQVNAVYFGAAAAVLNDAASSLTISHSKFERNSVAAILGGGEDLFQGTAVGAAITIGGGSQANIVHTVFRSNAVFGGHGAVGEPGGNAFGGAINIADVSLLGPTAESTLLVVHSQFIGNHSVSGNGGDGATGENGMSAGYSQGGAVSTGTGAESTFIHTLFVGNEAIGGKAGNGTDGGIGGGPPIFPVAGGAIENAGGTLFVQQSKFLRNKAVAGAGGDGATGGDGTNAAGGAIYNGFSYLDFSLSAYIEIENSRFAFNEAIGGAGGNGTTNGDGEGGDGQGGAIAGRIGEMQVRGGIIARNKAQGGAGANAAGGGNGLGGGIFNDADSLLRLKRAIITKNVASAGQGSPDGTGIGGGIFNFGELDAKKKDLALIFGNMADAFPDLFDDGP